MPFETCKIQKIIKEVKKGKAVAWCEICNGYGYHCNKRPLEHCPNAIKTIKDKDLEICSSCSESVLCYDCKGERCWVYIIPDNSNDWKYNAIC